MASGRFVHRFDLDDGHALHLFQGSLVEVTADALVSSDDNQLSAGGGVSLALARAAGAEVAQDRRRLAGQRHIELGEVVRTSAGGLPCRHLYHAVTIEFHGGGGRQRAAVMDSAVLRELLANVFARAEEDGARTLGLPALGTGSAGFDLQVASRIMIAELLGRLVESSVRHVVLALIGDEAEQTFYEDLVRQHASRCATAGLRRAEVRGAPPAVAPVELGPAPETGEQFASLVDAERLAMTPPEAPRLVSGLARLVLEHAGEEEVERFLQERPECHEFRGSVAQRLTEFLYLGEDKLRIALGQDLFRSSDLRSMATALGEDVSRLRDARQLVDAILQALCFNLLAPPEGLTHHMRRLDELAAGLSATDAPSPGWFCLEAGRVLEGVLRDLLRLYAVHLLGPGFEDELVRRKLVDPRRDGGHLRLTLGQAREVLGRLEAATVYEPLRSRLATLGRSRTRLLPVTVALTGGPTDAQQVLVTLTKRRNEAAHQGQGPGPDRAQARAMLEHLRAFLQACREEGAYPEVLRYEGAFENRNGERFVHFLDERDGLRKVRTDEKIDPRRHYYCFATNNPVHLFPVLVPKL